MNEKTVYSIFNKEKNKLNKREKMLVKVHTINQTTKNPKSPPPVKKKEVTSTHEPVLPTPSNPIVFIPNIPSFFSRMNLPTPIESLPPIHLTIPIPGHIPPSVTVTVPIQPPSFTATVPIQPPSFTVTVPIQPPSFSAELTYPKQEIIEIPNAPKPPSDMYMFIKEIGV
jgi:hypothetical protein